MLIQELSLTKCQISILRRKKYMAFGCLLDGIFFRDILTLGYKKSPERIALKRRQTVPDFYIIVVLLMTRFSG